MAGAVGNSEACRRYLDEELRLVSVKDLGRAKKALDGLLKERKSIADQVRCEVFFSPPNPDVNEPQCLLCLLSARFSSLLTVHTLLNSYSCIS